MNKNRNVTVKKTVAVATVASLLMSSQAYAGVESAILPKEDEKAPEITKGPYGGFFGSVAEFHKDAEKAMLNEGSDRQESTNAIVTKVEDIKTEDISSDNGSVDTVCVSGPLFANVKTSLNIRSTPSINGELVGQLRPTDAANIISYSDGWYEISSGEVSGFVSGKYSITGEEAIAIQEKLSTPFITCKARSLNVRSDATTESDVLDKLRYKEQAIIDPEAEEIEGWVGIIAGEEKGYVSKEYVEVYDGELSTAITAEEIEASKIQREKEAITQKQQVSPQAVQNPPISATVDDETLLAALLICEAGGSYEGMLAVGGVVMNRLRSGYAGDLRGVIYQRGQFTPAGSGKVDRTIAAGVNDSARQAAREALAGTDITGGCLNFRAAWTGHHGVNIGGNVFF